MTAKIHRHLYAMLAAALVTWAATAPARADDAAELRVMTYNIRLDIASDGPNAWPHRKDWVADQVQWLRPDVLGMQEVLPGQRADLVAALPGYRWIGEGRDGEGKGEAVPIAFLEARFELLASGTFWLSPTPEKSSKAWDAAFPRVVTWTRLRMLPEGPVVLAINTHWDHIGLVARRESAKQILRWIEANAGRCDHVLLFGDFNSTLDSEQLKTLTGGRVALRDARAISRTAPFGPEGTFTGFKTVPEPRAIDHLFVGEAVAVRRYAVFSQIIDGRVPSDHFPVLVDVALTPCPAR